MNAVVNPYTAVLRWRRGADVKRWHTWPMLREQTVGAHTFNALTLLYTVAPDARPEVYVALMMHDMHEQATADVPSTTKWRFPKLKEALTEAEHEWEESVSLGPVFSALEPHERVLVMWCDYMELLLWCTEEVRLGNENGAEPLFNILSVLEPKEPPSPTANDIYRQAREAAMLAIERRKL